METEKRLIDAKDAVKLLRGKCVAKYPSTFLMGLLASATEIEQIPTVDAVEVVRCKDCKYAMDMMPIENSGGYMMGECTLRKEDDIVFTAWGDDFCSYGERKADG